MRDRLGLHDWDIDGYPGEYVYGDDVYVDDYYIDMDERWLPINGFPGYWVSNCARVWSSKTRQFLTIRRMDAWGHLGCDLCRNGIRYHTYIHRLMAEAFIPNKYGDPIVRHFDDDPSNNCIDNLGWGTNKDNTEDAIRNKHFRRFTEEDREKALRTCRIPIIATNTNTGEQYRFEGVGLAAKALGIARTSVSKVLTGVRDEVHGWTFEYLDEEGYDE